MTTDDVLNIAKDVYVERNLQAVVVVSTEGTSGLAAAKRFQDLNANVVVAS